MRMNLTGLEVQIITMTKGGQMNEEKLRLSTSRINNYLHCPKKYWWTYHEQLVPTKRASALQVGALVHLLLQKDVEGNLDLDFVNNLVAEVKSEYPGNTPEEDISIAHEALNLYQGYKQKFQDDPYKVESSETHLELDMGDYTLYTRLDTLVRDSSSRLWRGEYKTTARIDSAYLSGLKSGLQAGISYIVSSAVLPEKLSGTVYSLLVKTKVPQYERVLVLAEKSLVTRTTECIKGVADGILSKRFYPSMQCHFYNRECEYLPLCKNDTQNTREAFYTHREEFYNVINKN
jgi:hypothetical protein